jgi:hypothetical protein
MQRAGLKSFSHFEYCGAAQLLAKSAGDLTVENRDRLAGLLRENFKAKGRIRYIGVNDNFPAMDNVAACLGGELVDDAGARERGLEGLQELLALFKRRGLLSEYTSPTYTPITLLCFADIGEHCGGAEARRLAREIEYRVWLDLAAHFHGSTSTLAGPHSRAYTVDSVGHLNLFHMASYQAFGDRVWLNPAHFLFPPAEKQVIHHDGDLAFVQASAAWLAGGTYHPSREIERVMFDKPLPFRVSGTSEFGAAVGGVGAVMVRAPDGEFKLSEELFEYPSGELVATTYLTEDYAVGSANVQFHDGIQTDTFFVNFRRAERPSSLKEISTIYCRYAANDDAPGRPWRDARNRNPKVEWITLDLLGDAGRVRAVQKDGTVLAVYQSKAQFIDNYSALRLILAVPVFYRSMKRVALGDREGPLPLQSKAPAIVWLEDDYLFAAFRPLLLTNWGRSSAVSLREQNGFLTICFDNYEGPARQFTRKELLETLNGFVAEIGSRKEYGSFARFRERVLKGTVSDEIFEQQRSTRYSRPGVQLDIAHSLYFGGVKYMLVDGKPQPRPLFQATGAA